PTIRSVCSGPPTGMLDAANGASIRPDGGAALTIPRIRSAFRPGGGHLATASRAPAAPVARGNAPVPLDVHRTAVRAAQGAIVGVRGPDPAPARISVDVARAGVADAAIEAAHATVVITARASEAGTAVTAGVIPAETAAVTTEAAGTEAAETPTVGVPAAQH